MIDLHASQPASAPRHSALDRRAWVRFTCDLEVACAPTEEDPEILWPARVVNVSQGGVGLLLSRRFEPDTLLQVEVQIPQKGFSRPMIVQVKHVTGHNYGGWLMGCSFTQPLDEDEVRQLA